MRLYYQGQVQVQPGQSGSEAIRQFNNMHGKTALHHRIGDGRQRIGAWSSEELDLAQNIPANKKN
jgi:hypothetical protein